MPIYEYQCLRCSERLETMQRWSDPPPAECPKCGGELKKLVSAPAFQFKGTGWYVTDYAKKGTGGEASDRSSDGGSSDGGKDAGGAETSGKSSGETASSPPESSSAAASSSSTSSTSSKAAGSPKD